MEGLGMSDYSIKQQADLIWSIADVGLRNNFKTGEYGHYIIPLTILKRFDCVLESSKGKVLAAYEEHKSVKVEEMRDRFLKDASGFGFYNTSKYTLTTIMNDPANIRVNLDEYLDGFSQNVREIMDNKLGMKEKIAKLDEKGILLPLMMQLNKPSVDLHPDKVSDTDMGYIFEEIVRRFSEKSNDGAGEHYTPREVIKLMTDILLSGEDLSKSSDYTVYDPACGTGGMLSVAEETIRGYNMDSRVSCFGQEINDETYAICKADMLIKGQDDSHIRCENTLTNDQFSDLKFDFVLSNPPFGSDWKAFYSQVKIESESDASGRFRFGLPRVDDSQALFLMTALDKMKPASLGGGKVAIIHTTAIMTGGSKGVMELRRHLVEKDILDAIICLPGDIFYNTPIAACILILDNCKPDERRGKIQLIDARKLYVKRKEPANKKKKDIDPDSIRRIVKAYGELEESDISHFIHPSDFGVCNIAVEHPKRDSEGKVIIRKGRPIADPDGHENLSIPVSYDVQDYFDKTVLSKDPCAWIDNSKTTFVYDIEFSKYFVKQIVTRSSYDVMGEIRALNAEVDELMDELFKTVG